MKKRAILTFIGILMLLAGIGAGVFLIRQQQLIEKKASVPGGIATIYLSPQTGTAGINQTFKVDVMVDAKGQTIKNIAAVIKLPQSNDFAIHSVTANESLSQNTMWRYVPSPSFTSNEDGTDSIIFSLGITGIEGYTNPEPFMIGSIYFRGIAATTIQPVFELAQSQVILFPSDNEDILNSNLNTLAGGFAGSYSIGTGGGTEPSITPSPTSSTSPTSSPTPTSPASPTSSPTPTSPASPTSPPSTPTPDPRIGISITSPQNAAILNDTTPTFSGKAAPRARILGTITGSTTANGSTTADVNGNWSWTSTTLNLGTHTASFNAYDETDHQTNASVNFTISSTASGGSSTSSGTGNDGADSGTLPVAGSTIPTLAFLITGLSMLMTGGYFLLRRN
jgi:hypothetical protein